MEINSIGIAFWGIGSMEIDSMEIASIKNGL